MLTHIEIDGFKTFEDFSLNLKPFTAIVGPNASGKSNLFDAIRFLSALAQNDIRTAVQNIRGEPAELFRRTPQREFDHMTFAIEVLLEAHGEDAFGSKFELKTQRIRYELKISRRKDPQNNIVGIFVEYERCTAIKKSDDRAIFLKELGNIKYSGNLSPFIQISNDAKKYSRSIKSAIIIRQDGIAKRGRPIALPLADASRTGLSTVVTAEFPHLYALKEFLSSIKFLQIDPQAARRPSDSLASRSLEANGANLATVLAKIKNETSTKDRPNGVLSDIAADLAFLIPTVQYLNLKDDPNIREYSFSLSLLDDMDFSSRVISDGTLRILSLLTVLNDPKRRGLLCFEEPENGIHEGRIPRLVELLRDATTLPDEEDGSPFFQILTNTHSPAVMESLNDDEIVAADIVGRIDKDIGKKIVRTRMRTGLSTSSDLIDPDLFLTCSEIQNLLRNRGDDA